ncbi:hypothetical protein Nepgr_017545 [Nepenthes gracilis]|uniref:Uncharacterized protein n=1 Tax=Nepenthes gracilis TaxID=150966 RepID=A0AAD3XT71_NEPGR|nr:hypothetical protein Nepgr_017545 [Nepenthes gracilis]
MSVTGSDNRQHFHLSAAAQPVVSKGGWRSAIFIIFMEVAERFAYYGIAGNLTVYLMTVVGEAVATAAKNVNNWNGVLSVALVIGAFLADSYFGRFKTTVISTTIFLMGLILLTISTSSVVPHHLRKTIFFMALYVVAVGDGGHRPCVQTFAVDQFDEEMEEEKKAKSSFFNWWYLGVVIGATTAVLVVIYIEENVGWTTGFAILTVVEAMALAVFLLGSRTYRRQRPVGSPFTRVAQVLVAAVRKRRLKETRRDQAAFYEEDPKGCGPELKQRNVGTTNQFRCLDKAAIIDDNDASREARNPWRLCSINEVEQVKLLFRLLPIWLCCLGYAIIVAQAHTFFIKQATTMNRRLGRKFQFPAAYLQAIPGITILISVPIYDKVFVPAARKITGVPSGITPVQRIGIGLALSTLTIVIAALVEVERLRVASHNGLLDAPKSVVPMTFWWLAPQFIVMGLSDLFAYVGMQELFYDQMPEDMRSMGSALTNGATGVGSFISSAVISAVQGVSARWGDEWLVNNLNRAHLDYFYWVLAGLCALDVVIYVLVAKWFVRKKIDMS